MLFENKIKEEMLMKSVELLEKFFVASEKNFFLSGLKMISSNDLLEFYDSTKEIDLKRVLAEAYSQRPNAKANDLLKIYNSFDELDFKRILIRAYITKPDAEVEVAKRYLSNEVEEIRSLWIGFYAQREKLNEREKQLILSYGEINTHYEKMKFVERYVVESENAENEVSLIYKLETNFTTRKDLLDIFVNLSNTQGMEKIEKIIELYKNEDYPILEIELLRILKKFFQGLDQKDIDSLYKECKDDKYLANILREAMTKSLSFCGATNEIEPRLALSKTSAQTRPNSRTCN